MLALEKAAAVRRLLAEGDIRHRKIARLTGISRGTVRAIASGRWRGPRSRIEPRDDELEAPTGPSEHCHGCGHAVYMPCVLCNLRRMFRKNPPPSTCKTADIVLEPLG